MTAKRINPYLNGLAEMRIGDLVEVIFQAVGAVETEEIEWKREWNFADRGRRATIAKHLIGFANRDPDRAAKSFGGHAYLVIGVEPGQWGQAPDLDPAELIQALDRFTGPALAWNPVYVEVLGHRVLVLVVDPPQWGDPVHSFLHGTIDHETGREIKRGTAFVRRPGTTRPASDKDLGRLEDRARVPRPRLQIAGVWNLGRRGNYIGVGVRNGVDGARAVLREVGFTLRGPAEVCRIPGVAYPPAEPELALAYVSFPIVTGEEVKVLEPGEGHEFRVHLTRFPMFWDADTDLFPYIFFDDGHWLVGPSEQLVGLVEGHGWVGAPGSPSMFESLRLNYVWPKSVEGLQATCPPEGEAMDWPGSD